MPSILQRYVLREALRVALLSIVALTAVMFVGMSVSLMRRGINVLQLANIFPYVAAMSLPYALPTAFLLACVFVFGRLSGQNEITAMRSSGVNLNHVVFPLLAVGLSVSLLTFALNHGLLPWSMMRVKIMREKLIPQVIRMVGGTYRQYEVGNYLINVAGVDKETGGWRNVAVIEFKDEFPVRVLTARRGGCRIVEERSLAIFDLEDGTVLHPRGGSVEKQPPVKFQKTSLSIDLSEEMDLSPDKPKYLQFKLLYREIQTLKKQAAEIRELPEYAAVRHPRTARKLMDRTRNQAWRDYSRLTEELQDHLKDVDEARAGVEKAESEVLAARAVLERASKRAQECSEALQRQRQFRLELIAEHKALVERNALPRRIRERADELQNVEAQLKELEALLAGAEREVERAETALKPREEVLALRRAAFDSVSTTAAGLQEKANAAAAVFNDIQKKVGNLRILERDLRARTDFHFRNAGALTPFIFMLIGIPLGILSRHGNIILSFVISFFVVLLIYYPLMFVGHMLSIDGYLAPVAGEWMGNVVVGGIGAALITWGVRR